MVFATRATLFSAAIVGLSLSLRSELCAQQLDPAFHPPLFAQLPALGSPQVAKVVRQADGRYLVAGRFQTVDGHATAGLARLLPTGLVDTTFTYRATSAAPTNTTWLALAVQADGKVLVAAQDTARQGNLRRLLPSGRPDATFHPALGRRLQSHVIAQIIVQPDGKLLMAGGTTDSLGRNGLLRLLPNGRVDATFQPPVLPANPGTMSMALEPSGRILYTRSSFLSSGPLPSVVRLLASGRPDSTFAFVPLQSAGPQMQISKIARCPDGSYALAGWFANKAVARLTSAGAWDVAFPTSLDCVTLSLGFSLGNPISAIAVQPDGRVMASGSMVSNLAQEAPLLRTLSGGGTDAAFDPDFIYTRYQSPNSSIVLNQARVLDLLMEPGGQLLVAGQFAQAGGVPHTGLARLLAATPLAVHGAAANAAALQVWPVPAHAQLNVALPAGTTLQQIALLDALGRRVLTRQPTPGPLTLDTSALPTGLYVLRVSYADGSEASRRVVLE